MYESEDTISVNSDSVTVTVFQIESAENPLRRETTCEHLGYLQVLRARPVLELQLLTGRFFVYDAFSRPFPVDLVNRYITIAC